MVGLVGIDESVPVGDIGLLVQSSDGRFAVAGGQEPGGRGCQQRQHCEWCQ